MTGRGEMKKIRTSMTASEAISLLKKTEDDNYLWKDAMDTIRRSRILPDAASGELAEYRNRWAF